MKNIAFFSLVVLTSQSLFTSSIALAETNTSHFIPSSSSQTSQNIKTSSSSSQTSQDIEPSSSSSQTSQNIKPSSSSSVNDQGISKSDPITENNPEVKTSSTTQSKTEAVIQANWGTCPVDFNSETGELTVHPGTLGMYSEKDYIDTTNLIRRDSIKSVKFLAGVSTPADSSNLFAKFSKLESFNGANLDVSNTTNMYGMLSNLAALKTVDISTWKTDKVTNMQRLFFSDQVVTSINLGNLNTSNVTTMESMFSETELLTSIQGIEKLNTSKVQNMQYMFNHSQSIKSLNLGSWDVSNVTTMEALFQFSSNLENLNLKNWDTKNVINTQMMFSEDHKLNSLELGPKTVFHLYTGLTLLPLVDTSDGTLSGGWERSVPQNPKVFYKSSLIFLNTYDGSNPGTYVWQKNQQSITASDVEAYVSDALPSDEAFKASAKDKFGEPVSVTLDKSKVDMNKVGDYDVLVTAQDGQTKTVKVHVKSGGLILNSVPNLDFGTLEISHKSQEYFAKNPSNALEVTDQRSSGTWSLSAKWATPLVGANTQTDLSNSLFYVNSKGEKTAISSSDSTIYSTDHHQTGITNVSKDWSASVGFCLEISPGQALPDDYSGTIEWTLSNVPSSEDKSSIKVHNSTLDVGDKWTASDNFDGGTDEAGMALPFSKVTVGGDKVDTSKEGDYKVTYTYGQVTQTATVSVTASPKLEDNGTIDFMNEKWDIIKGPDQLGAGNYLIALEDQIGHSAFNPTQYYNKNDDSWDGYQDSLAKPMVDKWYNDNLKDTSYENYVQPVVLSNPTLGEMKKLGWSSNVSGGGLPPLLAIDQPDAYPTKIDSNNGSKQAFLMSGSDVSNGKGSVGDLTPSALRHKDILNSKGFGYSWLRSPADGATSAAYLDHSWSNVAGNYVYANISIVPSLIVHIK